MRYLDSRRMGLLPWAGCRFGARQRPIRPVSSRWDRGPLAIDTDRNLPAGYAPAGSGGSSRLRIDCQLASFHVRLHPGNGDAFCTFERRGRGCLA